MSESTSEVPRTLWIRGGDAAPEQARRHVLSHLDHEASEEQLFDAALIVSELVTNSVIHANVGIDEALCIELTPLHDHLRIAVSDRGSELEPRLLPLDPATPGGFGLHLIDQMSSAWGVAREASGATCVWCELPLNGRVH